MKYLYLYLIQFDWAIYILYNNKRFKCPTQDIRKFKNVIRNEYVPSADLCDQMRYNCLLVKRNVIQF